MTLLVTGGAGFIGSNFILDWLKSSDESVINLDKLTYAGNLVNLTSLSADSRHVFVRGDINDSDLVFNLLVKHNVRAVIHFAAESHVDRSIEGPEPFIQTNIVGTLRLLEATRYYLDTLDESRKQAFRFIHISTDEVFGSLEKDAPAFTELSRYEPNSPYSASKASSDHLVRAFHQTYALPTIITNCSNNYGPYQFPEKLIPLCIHNALAGIPIPIYGNGQQIRDWLYVSDHCAAICKILEKGTIGGQYNIGGFNEKTNNEVVIALCSLLDNKIPLTNGRSYTAQISYVKDRPGHDHRYAINASKLASELNWTPLQTFELGINKTVDWYLDNEAWVRNVHEITSGQYQYSGVA